MRSGRSADLLNKCYMAGVPRMMYLEWPFQILQTRDHIAMAFEWTQVYRLIYTNGTPHDPRAQPWMGDSRGRWEGDTLVVDVANHNDQTWLDAAGNFHSDALRLVERYTMRDADTIQYEVTIEDPKVFTRPWKISMPFHRQHGIGPDPRVSLPGGEGRSERRLRTRAAHVVSRAERAERRRWRSVRRFSGRSPGKRLPQCVERLTANPT